MEIENVIGKIKKLCSKTVENGCTEEEAMAAAAKVGELLEEYNLSLDKIFLNKQTCVKGIITMDHRNYCPVDTAICGVHTFCECKYWYHPSKKYNLKHVFFGLPTDVEMAQYLCAVIRRAFITEVRLFKASDTYYERNEHGRSLINSFEKGMASRICERLREMVAYRNRKVVPSTSTDIVILKNKKIEKEFDDLDIELGSGSSYDRSQFSDYDAYNQGKEAGDKVNFNRPLSSVKS